MLAARDAEERGESNSAALRDFYRALMTATLLLPVPPDHGDEADAALEGAVNDDAEVEISVMLAADADGQPISVCFASFAALSAWAPRGTASLPIPSRIAVANMAAAKVPPSWIRPVPSPTASSPMSWQPWLPAGSPTAAIPSSRPRRRDPCG